MKDLRGAMAGVSETYVGKLWELSLAYDYGMISAYQNTYGADDNLKRSVSLLAKLQLRSVPIVRINEIIAGNEIDTFFVADTHRNGDLKSALLTLGEEFNLDGILFGKAKLPSVLIGTSRRDGARTKFHEEDTQIGILFDQDGKIIPNIQGRPFVFSETLNDNDLAYYKSRETSWDMRGPSFISRIPWKDLKKEHCVMF